MTAIERFFFTPLYQPQTAWDVVKWWEERRPIYNGVIGSLGLVTLGTVALLHPGPPLMFAGFAAVYGVLANICYTLGPVADLVLRRFLGDRAPAVGTVLFRYGFAFSIGLTMLPIPLAIAGKLLEILLK